ncbi:MAG TPA: hypothetical protein DCY94_01715 [Firmicutes bacterium]|nr:hypothetical protein [Bacillota bacterium]
MDIAYNKDTLYVYLDDRDDVDYEALERRVDDIMRSYEIERLVVDSKGKENEHLHEFEWNYNKRHRNRVVIK